MRFATIIAFFVVFLILLLLCLQAFTDFDFPSFSSSLNSEALINDEQHKNLDGKPLKIAIITFSFLDSSNTASPQVKNKGAFYHSLSWINKQSYCRKWGYDYILANETEIMKLVMESFHAGSSLRQQLMNVKAWVWGKLLAIEKYLSRYDVIMWSDTDSLIMNFDFSIPDIMAKATMEKVSSSSSAFFPMSLLKNNNNPRKTEEYFKTHPSTWNDFVAAKDYGGLNAGIFFLKNTTWSHDFIKRVFEASISEEDCPVPLIGYEQRTMMCMLRGGEVPDKKLVDSINHEKISGATWPEDKKHVQIVRNQRLFNSFGYPRLRDQIYLLMRNADFRKNDFVNHFAGCSNEYRLCTGAFKLMFDRNVKKHRKWYDRNWLETRYKNGTFLEELPTYIEDINS